MNRIDRCKDTYLSHSYFICKFYNVYLKNTEIWEFSRIEPIPKQTELFLNKFICFNLIFVLSKQTDSIVSKK